MKSKVLFFVYHAIYFVGWLCFLPLMLWKRRSVWRRLFPFPIESELHVWIHAASVGELLAVATFARFMREKNPNIEFVVSTVTPTGLEAARKAIPYAHAHLLLPFDFLYSVRRLFRRKRPSLLLLSEGDIWPVFLREAKKDGANCIVVNGKISQRSVARLSFFSWIGSWLFSSVDLFCVQSQEYKERYRFLGVLEESISVCGNLKADSSISRLSEMQKNEWRAKLGVHSTDKLIVVGSTHNSEEEGIMRSLFPLCKRDPFLKILFVPRHPERAFQVQKILRGDGVDPVLFSEFSRKPWKVMIFDQLGVLQVLYQLAYIAIVAGSFVKHIGGHNILEPTSLGVPTLVGPYMHSQQELFDSAIQKEALISTSLEGLSGDIERLFDEQEYRRYKENGQMWAESTRGAIEKTFSCMENFLLGRK